MKNLFNLISVIAAVLMVVTILLQTRGQSLGASFGGDSSNFYRSKRGAERIIYNGTIILAIIFVLSVILSILAKR